MNESIDYDARPRRIQKVIRGTPTSDGAGVRLNRVIGGPSLDMLDPFLLLDEFGTDKPEDYIAGFPSHPHRGFETVTYMLDGRMRHRDNHGHEGVLGPGSVQWMSAARGIVHSEMPEQEEGRMRGFQLWINLPADRKMGEPRYQEHAADAIPAVRPNDGVTAKVIAGEVDGTRGPVQQPATDPVYLDVLLDTEAVFEPAIPAGHSNFVYVYEGELAIGSEDHAQRVTAGHLAVLSDGDSLRLQGIVDGSRAIVVAGRPLREPVARYGPFVMNTKQEIIQAVEDFNAGRF
ncbi:MAG: pirin family protein [Lysobacteraceae bacterium]